MESTMKRGNVRDSWSTKGGDIHDDPPTRGRFGPTSDPENTTGEIVNFVVQCLITSMAALIGNAVNGWEGAGWAFLGVTPLASAMGYLAACIVDRR